MSSFRNLARQKNKFVTKKSSLNKFANNADKVIATNSTTKKNL